MEEGAAEMTLVQLGCWIGGFCLLFILALGVEKVIEWMERW
jgi:hypothetical protein